MANQAADLAGAEAAFLNAFDGTCFWHDGSRICSFNGNRCRLWFRLAEEFVSPGIEFVFWLKDENSLFGVIDSSHGAILWHRRTRKGVQCLSGLGYTPYLHQF